MFLNATSEDFKLRSMAEFKCGHVEAWSIVQAATGCPRYPLSYRNLEEIFLECGLRLFSSRMMAAPRLRKCDHFGCAELP